MTRRNPGFSLIEVLIANVIFALAAGILTQAFVNILMSLDNLEVEASYQADLQFVRALVIKEPDLELFEDGGEVETLTMGTAIWEAEVEPAEVVDLFRVKLRIELSPPEQDTVIFEEELLLLRPTWSDPLDRSEMVADRRDQLQSDRLSKDWQ